MRMQRILWVIWAVVLAALASVQAQMVPFVLPWDDATPGITDFSGMNRPIDSESRVTVDENGRFVVGGSRIRFLGMNFAGDSPFMSTNKAEGVASRLAKFGINNVRFHHLDAPWATGGGILAYTTGTSRTMNMVQLERMHYVVSRLKAHGVFVNVNLLVGRQFRSADGIGSEVSIGGRRVAELRKVCAGLVGEDAGACRDEATGERASH